MALRATKAYTVARRHGAVSAVLQRSAFLTPVWSTMKRQGHVDTDSLYLNFLLRRYPWQRSGGRRRGLA